MLLCHILQELLQPLICLQVFDFAFHMQHSLAVLFCVVIHVYCAALMCMALPFQPCADLALHSFLLPFDIFLHTT